MNTVPLACGTFSYHAPLNLEELDSSEQLRLFAPNVMYEFPRTHKPKRQLSHISDFASPVCNTREFDRTLCTAIPQFLPVAAALQLFYENAQFLPDPTRARRLLWKISVSRKALVRLLVKYARIKRDCKIYVVNDDGVLVAHSGPLEPWYEVEWRRTKKEADDTWLYPDVPDFSQWQGYHGSMYDEAPNMLRPPETWDEVELQRAKEALTTGMLTFQEALTTGMLTCQRDDFAHFPATVDYTWRMRHAPQPVQEVEPWDLARARKAISMDSDDEDEIK